MRECIPVPVEPGTEVEREISDILPSFNFAFEVFASSVCLVPASPSFVQVVTEVVSTSPSKPTGRLLTGTVPCLSTGEYFSDPIQYFLERERS
jgi:hypothetical protein